jgi:hypothetical protein
MGHLGEEFFQTLFRGRQTPGQAEKAWFDKAEIRLQPAIEPYLSHSVADVELPKSVERGGGVEGSIHQPMSNNPGQTPDERGWM